MPHKDRIRQILANPQFDRVEVIVVTDGERILGLGDQGAGGMGIPIGKLALYTGLRRHASRDHAADPARCRHRQRRSAWPIRSISAGGTSACAARSTTTSSRSSSTAVTERWPHVLLQWEDFAKDNATRLLERYRDRLCTFNDDIQGTAAVATGTLLAAINVTGVPLTEQRIAIFGAGSAGMRHRRACCCAAMVEAGCRARRRRQRFYLVDRDGLLVEGMNGICCRSSAASCSRATRSRAGRLEQPGRIGLLDVVRNAKPTVLIGVSGQPGAFSEHVVRAMAERNAAAGHLPAVQSDLARRGDAGRHRCAWTRGPRRHRHRQPVPAACARMAPTSGSTRPTTPTSFPASGSAPSRSGRGASPTGCSWRRRGRWRTLSPARHDPDANLLPPVTALREVSIAVAHAVALQARKEGLAEPLDAGDIYQKIRDRMWTPVYQPYRQKKTGRK